MITEVTPYLPKCSWMFLNFLELWISVTIIVFVFNAKTFAIAILVFFSFFPSRHFFWMDDCQKLNNQRFNFSYQENVWPRSYSFLGCSKTYLCKKYSLSCSSQVRGTLHSLCTVTSNLQHPKKHKKLPKPTARNSEISKLYS